MTLSFIVTTYNIADYVTPCLDSVAACLRRGDQLIVVDDGSTDRTDLILERRCAAGFGPGVDVQLIALGSNTVGGVGIPANIGLSHATRYGVFFVDGDDWLEPTGFLACRAAFEAEAPDILIANYLEYNDVTGQISRPADLKRWGELTAAQGDAAAERRLALSLIAVPWRKFYRRGFLGDDIRFPEGDFFFEDNPFHWQVCHRARTIAFHDRVLCRHRINRAGQTMASTGTEFMAFFDHFETICAQLPPDDPALRVAALEWLVNNMSWHISRMNHGAFWAYATRAMQVLEPEATRWAQIRHAYQGSAIGGMVEALVRGQIAGTVAAWMTERSMANMVQMESRLRAEMATAGQSLGQPATGALTNDRRFDQLQSLHLIEEFRALRALHEQAPATGGAAG